MKKITVKILLWLGFCFLLCGCSGESEEKIEITMIHGWGSTEADHVAMRQIYEDFEKEHPNIHLNLISMPSSTDVISKVGDLLTVGEIPDIVFTGGDGRESIFKFMVRMGYALDLIPYLEKDEKFANNISPVIRESWTTTQNRLYTVSDVLLLGGYWYNEEIFQKAGITAVPKTWEEWFAACEKIERLNQGVTPMILDSNHISYLMGVVLANEDPGRWDNVRGGQLNINTPVFEAVMNRLSQISDHAKWAGNYSYLDTLDSFNKGKSAMYINGVWANSMIDPNLKVSYAPFPSDDGKGIATRSACVGYILGNTGDRKRMEASVEFLKYMLSEPVAVRILEETGQVPSNPNIKMSEFHCSERLIQAVNCIENAGVLMETPENLWDLSRKKEYAESVMLYLQDKITEMEFRKRLSWM